jgi:tRNA modification GTPase
VGPSPEDAAIAAAIGERPGVVVFNKVDLPPRYPPAAAQALLAAAPVCTVSALTGAGIAALRSELAQLVVPTTGAAGDDLLLGNVRHVEALHRAADHLATAQATLDSAYPLDMVTIDLRGALDALGEVTGHTVTEDLLDKIFSTFCIGK